VPAARRTISPCKRGGRLPWRLVDSYTSLEVPFTETFDHPDLGEMQVSVCGFPSKAAAIHALGELAAACLPALPTSLRDEEVIARQLDKAGRALYELLRNPHAPLDRATRAKLREDQDILRTVYRRSRAAETRA